MENNKVGERLIFIIPELQTSSENQLIDSRADQNNTMVSIIKSVQRQKYSCK